MNNNGFVITRILTGTGTITTNCKENPLNICECNIPPFCEQVESGSWQNFYNCINE